MATSLLPAGFKEFLKLLNSRQVEYLLIRGYAVGYYGYPRATADMDIWIAVNSPNAHRIVAVIREFFGADIEAATPELFLQENKIARMGVPPFPFLFGSDHAKSEELQSFRSRESRYSGLRAPFCRQDHTRTASWLRQCAATRVTIHLND
ncbi:MAG: hypothetical protein AABZ67_03480 [Pseudomonadota bacterium]